MALYGYENPALYQFINLPVGLPENLPGGLFVNADSIRLQVRTLFLGEPENKKRFITFPIKNDRTKPARLAGVLPAYPLLDDATAIIGINQPLLSSLYRLAKVFVLNAFLFGKPSKPSVFENLQNGKVISV
jgi:hypothetical protein